MRNLQLISVLAVMLWAAAWSCSSAGAEVVTVGSPLTGAFAEPGAVSAPSTAANMQLPEAGATPFAPAAGVLVGWRLKGHFEGGPFYLQVLRRAEGVEPTAKYAAIESSAPETPVGESTQFFAMRLPVQAGDLIAIRTSTSSDRIGQEYVLGAFGSDWVQPLVEGGSPEAPHNHDIPVELGFNADLETSPDSILPQAGAPTTMPLVPTPCIVPKLRGSRLKTAKRALRRRNCKLGGVRKKREVGVAAGRVTAQSPKPGTVIAGGAAVKVTLAGGPPRGR